MHLLRQELQDFLGVAAGEAFRMDGLAALALDDHIAEQQMLADADAADALAHDNRLVIPDEFAFVISDFVVLNNQFVRENRVPVAGYPASLKFVFHNR